MASACPENVDLFDTVEPKRSIDDLEDLRKKAYIPNELPKDFLRVILNQQQLDENNDSIFALRLQQSLNVDQRFNHELTPERQRALAATLGQGRLQIDLLEARLTKNYGLLTRMDPYVRVKIGPKVYETPTDYSGGKNPKWRKTLMCYIPHNIDTITIEIYDEKSFTNDELIAFVNFPIPQTVFEGNFLDEWIPLSGKMGEQKEGHINIQLLFTPTNRLEPVNLNYYQPVQYMPRQSHVPSGSRGSSASSTSPPISPSNNSTLIQAGTVQLPPEVPVRQHPKPITEEDMKDIKEMFPTFDDDVIKSILEVNGGNKEATIESLLQMASDN